MGLLATEADKMKRLSFFSSGPPPPPPLLWAFVFGWQATTESVEPATPAAPMTFRNLPREILEPLCMANLPIQDSSGHPRRPALLHPRRARPSLGCFVGRAPASPRRVAPRCTGC